MKFVIKSRQFEANKALSFYCLEKNVNDLHFYQDIFVFSPHFNGGNFDKAGKNGLTLLHKKGLIYYRCCEIFRNGFFMLESLLVSTQENLLRLLKNSGGVKTQNGGAN